MQTYSKYYIVIGSCILIVALGLVTRWFWPNLSSFSGTHSSTTAQPTLTKLPGLNGMLVAEEIAQRRPVAMVIDNQPDARPQAGLAEADIVYETLAEGGITRFLAFYQTQATKNVGPIRSARIYFNELAEEWGALYAHVGGNSDALEALKQKKYPSIANADQFFFDSYFHRIHTRVAPHNVYTSIDTLYHLADQEHWNLTAPHLPRWQYTQTPTQSTLPQTISIPFSTPEYAVLYTYNPKENRYLRTVAGKAALDANTGTTITPSNIIIQFADTHPTKTDTVGSLSFDLHTGGRAIIVRGGTTTNGNWEQTDGHTQFVDIAGRKIELNPGQTWIEILPTELASKVIIK